MAQKPQIIDVTRSYVPGDPNSYPETLISTQREDGEEKLPPVSIYEGYNFMPTPYGYKSYFGTQAKLDIPALTSRVQFILSYQSAEYVNNLIALCEDGIWIIDPTADTNTWKHVVTHTFNSSVFEEWTWCIIENAIYCYKQGGASYYHTSNVDDVPNGLEISIVSVVPTFLNMAGQMGVFKAGTRLGFWDSANSVSWSSNLELNNFTPSLENLAGNTIFGAVLGRITHIRDHGEGFIVYSTKSIVGVSYEASSNLLWDAHTISTVGGVAVGREVTAGSGNREQFAWTTVGLFRIGSYNGLTKVTEFQPVAIELSDLLKESRNPVYLNCIDGRFLYLHCIDNDYINGITSFESVHIGDIPIDGIPLIDSQLIAPSLLAKMIQKIEKDTADATYGETLTSYVADATPFDVIEWEMSFRLPSTLGLYERDQNPGLGAKFDYLGAPGDLNRNTGTYNYPGWDDRTPTSGVFVPQDPNGSYIALKLIGFTPEAIISDEDFYDRSSLLNIGLYPIANLSTIFQVDAFLYEGADADMPMGSIIQEACNLNPSYLTLSARTGNGLLGEMYHIASLWKEYEKRQDLVIKRLQDLCANAEDRQYTVYSAAPIVVGDPALASTKIYKPYGSVGIMPMDKGFFFYKQYREYLDLTMVATRDETIIEHKQIADGQYAVPCTYAVESQVDLKVTTQEISPGHTAFPHYGYTPSITGISGTSGTYHYVSASIALHKIATGEISDKTQEVSFLFQEVGGSISVRINNAFVMPDGFNFRVYFRYPPLTGPANDIIRVYTGDLLLAMQHNYFTFAQLEALSLLAGFPDANRNIEGNTYIPTTNPTGWSIVEELDAAVSNYIVGTYTVYVATVSGSNVGPRVLLGTVDIDAVTNALLIVSPAIAGYTKYALYVAVPGSGGVSIIDYVTLGTPYILSDLYGDANHIYLNLNYDDPRKRPLTWDQDTDPTSGDPVTYELSLPTTSPYSPTLIRDLIEESQATPISWPDLAINRGEAETHIKFLDVDHFDQLLTAPWQLDGYVGIKAETTTYPITMYSVQVKAKQLVHVTNVAPEFMNEGQVSFKAQREPLAMYEEYPFLMANPGANEIVGYYQSIEQAIIQCCSYIRYLEAALQFLTNPETFTQFRPTSNLEDYYTVNRGDYLELHTQVFHIVTIDGLGWSPGDTYWLDATIMLLRQVDGYIRQYDEDEHLVGSLIDNEGTDLSGSFLTPSLDTSGGLNTFGALFTPKNKISCTISAGALVPGTSTSIDTYSDLEIFALGYLTDGSLSSSIYNIPPTYDEGEYWWYMKDADHIYHSGTLMNYKEGSVVSLPKQMWTTDLYLDNVTPHDVPTSEDLIITPSLGTLPGTTYNLQLGVPAPNYPTFKGAFVFDLGLKKWGKLKADYKNLISFSPLNNNMGGAIQYSNFGMDSGIMNAAGEIRPFDTAPIDSWIRIGKIGYYRLGVTNLLEVKAMFRSASTGSLTVDVSMDGRTLDPTLRHLTSFTGVANLTAYPDVSGRWHTIKIEGNYDLQYLEVRGTIAGRR